MTDTLYLHPDNPQVRFIRQAVTAMRGGAVSRRAASSLLAKFRMTTAPSEANLSATARPIPREALVL